MRIALSVLCLISSAIAVEIDPLSDEFIDLINSKQTSWVAGRNFPKETTMSDIKNLLGVRISEDLSLKYQPTVHNEKILAPQSFDARTNFIECKNVIGTIVDQSACASWAVVAASVMSDRRCIKSNGNLTVPVSALDLLSCCDDCGEGCKGGMAEFAFDYWNQTGIVTGGLYGSKQGCKPYSMKNCDHHVNGTYEPCPSSIYDTPVCEKKCSVESLDYKSEITYGETGMQFFRLADDIQNEIMKNGPVLSSFEVFSDFLHYKSGVYQHVTGKSLGGQYVRILGWGFDEDSALPYWLVANSWNEDWGDKGLFKIFRGQNECFIESFVVAALAKV